MKFNNKIPHYVYYAIRMVSTYFYSLTTVIMANFVGISLEKGCTFRGRIYFKKHPFSSIHIGSNCTFNSSPASNLIGVNRPCIISTLKKDAKISIGQGCGFSGTVIASAKSVYIGKYVKCGANTLINDTDWHWDDFRSQPDAPVKIGDNVWLGANVTILKGVTIGSGSIVGTGSVVTKSLPSDIVAAGNPARIIRKIKYE